MMINQLRFLILLILLCCTQLTTSYKLLVVSTSHSKSHMISAARIADTLTKNGHDVTFANIEIGLSITRFAPLANYPKLVTLGYVSPEEEAAFIKKTGQKTQEAFAPYNIQAKYKASTASVKGFTDACERVLQHNATLLNELKNEKFDAVFTEHFTACPTALTEVLNIPVHFLISSCALFEPIADIFGVPVPTGYVPAAFGLTSLTDEMSFIERARNQIEIEVVRHVFGQTYSSTTELFRKYYGNSFPDVIDIMRQRTPLIFIATDDLIDIPRPWPANAIRIGGLGMNYTLDNSFKPLEEPFETQMSLGAKGVVLFSLGSNTNTAGLPDSVKTNLFGAFAKLSDYHFIVKVDKEDDKSREIFKGVPNVFITTWAPQPALLQHPRLELFITHGGYNSILEVASAGKPILVLPMMYDQARNAAIIQRNGWGRSIDKQTLLTSPFAFQTELIEMLKTDKYKTQAKRIQKLLQTKPFSADDVFMRYVEFALANDGQLPELQSVASSLNTVQQYNLDIWAIFFILIITLVCLFLKVITLLMQKFDFASKIKQKKN